MPNQTALAAPDPDLIYQKHVKHLEDEYRGQYALVTPDGLDVVVPTLLEATAKAAEKPDKNNFIFKVGFKAVGQIL